MEKSKTQRIHFIGIGGIGMSALARFYLHEGKVVSGSDRSTSAITDALVYEGAHFFASQVAENITADIDMVVYTEAMAEDHPEMVAARALDIPMMNYFDALGQIANEYYLIAVAGSHGKTTTTAMLADILEAADLDPTVIVGSLRSKTGSNFRAGKSKYAIVEACEYKRDFLSLKPDILVITNIEYEHVDYYQNLTDVQSAFRTLAEQVSADGLIIANLTDPAVVPVVKSLKVNVMDYRPLIDLNLKLRQPGLHNQMNAAAAAGVAAVLGIAVEVTTAALKNFAGTWRRFEFKGEVAGAPIYDDYAHHPTEIKATIGGVRELYPDKKLLVVFQSHTYSRTHELFTDFVSSLALADQTIILPIYAAREENVWGVTSEQIVQKLVEAGKISTLVESPVDAALLVKELINKEFVVVVMGAGPVTEVGTILTK